MKIKLLATIVTMLPLAGIAAEGDTTPTATTTAASSSFDTVDSNKDGRISMPEASVDPKLVEGFTMADKNSDGYLDKPEFDGRAAPQK